MRKKSRYENQEKEPKNQWTELQDNKIQSAIRQKIHSEHIIETGPGTAITQEQTIIHERCYRLKHRHEASESYSKNFEEETGKDCASKSGQIRSTYGSVQECQDIRRLLEHLWYHKQED